MSFAIAAGIEVVRERIGAAARRAGRDPSSVALLAATKTVTAEDVLTAARAGLHIAGENIVQEFLAKRESLANEPDAARLQWHFIGTLQRNKAGKIAGLVDLVHSVDTVALAEALSRRSEGDPQDILLEVNTSGEDTKHGFGLASVRDAVDRIGALEGVRIRGAMTMAPPRDAVAARRCFRALADVVEEGWWPKGATELSMGMSDDFEIGVEEGATIVRVGSAIFGARCDAGLGA